MVGREAHHHEVRQAIESALTRATLSSWERKFLADMRNRLLRYGQSTRLSDKQVKKLESLLGRPVAPASPFASSTSHLTSRDRYRAANSLARSIRRRRWRRGTWWKVRRIIGTNTLIGSALAVAIIAIGILVKPLTTPAPIESASAAFTLCGRPPHSDCVIDGDTFYWGNQSIRIADIDAPEVSPPRCEHERELGARATRRLHELLNAGPFQLTMWDNRDVDQYGRKLRVAKRNGNSLGMILVSEGLAWQWTGQRLPWCD